jgi:hypothetical protein
VLPIVREYGDGLVFDLDGGKGRRRYVVLLEVRQILAGNTDIEVMEGGWQSWKGRRRKLFGVLVFVR